MDEHGPPIAYTALVEGTPVYDLDLEEVGVVEDVVGDLQLDIFDGVIIHTLPLPGRHLFADADQIGGLHERAVLLKVPREALHEPPRPREGDGADDGSATPEGSLQARLRRAWDRVAPRS